MDCSIRYQTEGSLVRSSPSADLYNIAGRIVWIPKSIQHYDRPNIIDCPMWFAFRVGLTSKEGREA